MSQINRPPLGLQSLLGSQNFGVNPDQLARTVQPIVDMTPFWRTQLLRRASTAGGSTGVGVVATLPIFAGQLWAIRAISAHRTTGFTGAGPHSLQVALTIDNVPGQTGKVFLGESPIYTNLDGTTHFAFSVRLPEPLIVEPNSEVELLYLQNTLANPDSLTLSVLYYALDA